VAAGGPTLAMGHTTPLGLDVEMTNLSQKILFLLQMALSFPHFHLLNHHHQHFFDI